MHLMHALQQVHVPPSLPNRAMLELVRSLLPDFAHLPASQWSSACQCLPGAEILRLVSLIRLCSCTTKSNETNSQALLIKRALSFFSMFQSCSIHEAENTQPPWSDDPLET